MSAALLAFVHHATIAFQVLDQKRLALLALEVSLPICVGIALIPQVRMGVARLVHSDLHRVKSQALRKVLITLFVVGWALIVVASNYLLLATYNAMGDHGKAVCRPMLVVKKSMSGGGAHSPIMKYFVLAPEEHPEDTIKIAVPGADYRQARENQTQVELCVKQGALSMPWVSACLLVR
jgi:hypothetical protein